MSKTVMTLGVVLVLAGEGALMAADVIVNPRVTTDRGVDSASPKTIVAGLVRPGMTDQDKALAIYNYMRRVMFHYRHLTNVGGGGATNLINGVGYCLCTPTAGAQVELCEAAGIKAKILSLPGHGSVDVFFDGHWHWMDAFLGGCVWDKDRKSLADLPAVVADPSLLKREDPSPVAVLPCRDLLYQDAVRFEPDLKKYHEECAPDDFAWVSRAAPGKRGDNGWQSSMTLDITLRPGETYTRNWDHEPGMYFLTKVQDRFAPPHHFCGIDAEQRDTINWPYFKPYVKEITSLDPKSGKPVTVKTGRYWANGSILWRVGAEPPPLSLFRRAENLRWKDGAFVAADPAKPAVLEWETVCPYMLQGGEVSWRQPEGDANAAGVTASTAIVLSKGDRPTPMAPEPIFTPLVSKAAGPLVTADLRPHFLEHMGARGYVLRIELNGPSARLAGLSVRTVFQHNMYTLPQLMPGKNEAKVALANPGALKDTRFFVEFAWDQDGKTKTDRRQIDKSPYTFVVDIPGAELPRMRYLRMTNGE